MLSFANPLQNSGEEDDRPEGMQCMQRSDSGRAHGEMALDRPGYQQCEEMTTVVLRTRLSNVLSAVSAAPPRPPPTTIEHQTGSSGSRDTQSPLSLMLMTVFAPGALECYVMSTTATEKDNWYHSSFQEEDTWIGQLPRTAWFLQSRDQHHFSLRCIKRSPGHGTPPIRPGPMPEKSRFSYRQSQLLRLCRGHML